MNQEAMEMEMEMETIRVVADDGARGENDGRHCSFASDFYKSGTDWSCLLKKTSNGEKNEEEDEENEASASMNRKRLKQTNLFQMWGVPHEIKVHTHDTSTSKVSNNGDDPIKTKAKPSMARFFNSTSNTNNKQSRGCPFYKKIPGTPFTVDAFRYGSVEGCSAYFLSHFHADHYGGLSKEWSHGPIYCTSLTARLVKSCLSVNSEFISPLEMGIEYVIMGIKVTMLEANHCPGAALIHMCLPNGRYYLHTGDFRACKLMQDYPLLLKHQINVLYLDTTYCNPKYRFPLQEDIFSYVVRVTMNCLQKQPKTLVIVGSYSIGKEGVYLSISKALGVKIFAKPWKRRILQSYGWPDLSGGLCSNEKETPLHVLPMSSITLKALESYLKSYTDQYKAVLAFRPTGWTYSETIGSNLDLIKPTRKGPITIYGVPYSEHSSFTELREFVQFLRPEKIIPTVNVGNPVEREKMQSYIQEWIKA